MKIYTLTIEVNDKRHDKLAQRIMDLAFTIAFKLGYKKIGIRQQVKGTAK